MSKRPVIGIPTQTQPAVPGELPRCWIMSNRYVQVLADVGAVPWLIPLLPADLDTLREIYNRLDAVFLTGGVDVDPSHYGEPRHPACGRTDADRDAVELQLTKWAIEDKKPLLAVCRGFQVLNVAVGGTLFQDLGEQYSRSLKHDHFPRADGTPTRDYLSHAVKLDPKSRLAQYLGSDFAPVNSMHHQGIKRLGHGLVANAWAPDGLIEGIEGANGQFLIAVQWHPEELAGSDAGMRRLFHGFIDAASGKT
ncbi:MAG: gamma-glutamyl-gamma-aminobutyrate hydrolase family protein [Gemmataceae bacterium]|nr:gamma-glutamyl-gamma-aminobutyrate hydrolase family protein [Gemmataceae bacterium]